MQSSISRNLRSAERARIDRATLPLRASGGHLRRRAAWFCPCVLYSRDYFYCLLPFANQLMHGIMTPDAATALRFIIFYCEASYQKCGLFLTFTAFLTLYKDLLGRSTRLNYFLSFCSVLFLLRYDVGQQVIQVRLQGYLIF